MPENYNVIIQELVRRSNEETRRLRMVEQRLDAMEDKLNTLVDNYAERNKKGNTRFADVEVNVKTINDEILNLKMGVDRISKQLGKFAQRRDIKEIEKMIELLTPANRLEPRQEPIEVKG